MLIDLHTHTNFSDGTLSPEELIDQAIRSDIGVLAITDHDEIGAVPVALDYAHDLNIKVIPGMVYCQHMVCINNNFVT